MELSSVGGSTARSGTTTTVSHAGHLTRFPACSSGTPIFWLHLLHLNLITTYLQLQSLVLDRYIGCILLSMRTLAVVERGTGRLLSRLPLKCIVEGESPMTFSRMCISQSHILPISFQTYNHKPQDIDLLPFLPAHKQPR